MVAEICTMVFSLSTDMCPFAVSQNASHRTKEIKHIIRLDAHQLMPRITAQSTPRNTYGDLGDLISAINRTMIVVVWKIQIGKLGHE